MNGSWHLVVSYINFYDHVFCFAIATVARAYEDWGQANSGEISPNCSKVEFERVYNKRTHRLGDTNGRSIQTLYEDSRQSKGDQLITAIVSFSRAYGGVSSMAFIYARWLLYKKPTKIRHLRT